MKKIYALMCTLFIPVISGCPNKAPLPPNKKMDNFDQFQTELANRSASQIGTADDFKIIVTQVAFPIGTLMRAGSTIPIDYSACTPPSTPVAYSAPSLFPSYTISKKLAVDLGLDNDVIKKLTDFGINVSDTDKINLSVKGTSIQTLADTDLKKTMSALGCKAVTKGTTAWFVRGYIEGQRNFSLEKSNSIIVKGKITKIASFNVTTGGGDQSVSLIDDKSVGFLQIISQISETKDNEQPSIEKPQVQSSTGKTYIQQDKLDLSNISKDILKALKERNIEVEQKIEKIPSSKMPKNAQVRYFNNSDIELAKLELTELRTFFPNAELKKIGLPAQIGHIEIWLPQAQ
ncbi:TPA: hypothetical protein ACTW6T_003868 [Klebsiella michiganensis]